MKKELNVDELVSLAMVASLLIGEYLAAAAVALIMVLGSLMEQFTAPKARSAIDSLIRLSPGQAAVIREGALPPLTRPPLRENPCPWIKQQGMLFMPDLSVIPG